MSNLYQKLPEEPGVYLFKGEGGRILYVGKAGNLRRRVSSYFVHSHDLRVEKLVSKIKRVDYRKTDSALEALILEAELIKKYKPPFNVREKDDKSFLYVEITDEKFPRVLLARGKNATSNPLRRSCSEASKRQATGCFGPFTSASNIREALRILRRIFPWSVHQASSVKSRASRVRVRPCFDYELGLCPGVCIGAISREDYLKNIKNLKLFFEGKKGEILRNLEKEMAAASKNLGFEKAEKLRRQIFALWHIRDTALIGDEKSQISNLKSQKSKIEGYDISNISGTSAVGSMVVFRGDKPDKNEYRKFRIRTITGADDVGMLKEVLRRRFKNDWPLPALILIDGGRGQVNVANRVLEEFGLKIPVVGIVKGPKRKRNDFIGKIPEGIEKSTLIKVRDEAHRFALGYHKRLRGVAFLKTGM